MRATTDLLQLDFVFSQRLPFTPDQFVEECKRRGLHLQFSEQLEAFHKAGVLIPLYRFAKNLTPGLRDWRREARRQGVPVDTLLLALRDDAVFRHHLRGIAEIGRPEDPRAEPYRSWAAYDRTVAGTRLRASAFLYSPYQILPASKLDYLVPMMRTRRTRRVSSVIGVTFHLPPAEAGRTRVERDAATNEELVIALTALETRYWPVISGTITNKRGDEVDPWFEYAKAFDPAAVLRWLGWNPERISRTAENLLHTADSLDPLSDWYELVRLCRFPKWDALRGDALVAMDFRIAAEMLLRFYEDLVQAGVAAPLPAPPRYARGAHSTRLGTGREELEAVLMDFGLSPHPSLVCVLEGDTEMLLMPRVFELLGIPLRPDSIRLFNAGGVARDLGGLAKYAATPELGEAITRGFLLARPPTRILVVFDPEQGFSTPEKREMHRKRYVNEIWRAIPTRERDQIPRSEIDLLVEVATWNQKGEVFEFAHFTDLQIARAILAVYRGPDMHSLADLQGRVANIRSDAGNIEHLWKGWRVDRPTKVGVADALWPVLKRRIEAGLRRNTYDRIPVVRIALHAREIAARSHRHSVMIRRG
jgi:hypothetical protein